MNLLDVFRRSKKASASKYLGRMWACAVKFNPCDKKRYDVIIKETGIESAWMNDGIARVESSEPNPFNKCNIIFRGPVGRLEYVSQSCQWIGFFETEDEAKDGYRRFADALADEIKSASAELGLPGETRRSPSA